MSESCGHRQRRARHIDVRAHEDVADVAGVLSLDCVYCVTLLIQLWPATAPKNVLSGPWMAFGSPADEFPPSRGRRRTDAARSGRGRRRRVAVWGCCRPRRGPRGPTASRGGRTRRTAPLVPTAVASRASRDRELRIGTVRLALASGETASSGCLRMHRAPPRHPAAARALVCRKRPSH